MNSGVRWFWILAALGIGATARVGEASVLDSPPHSATTAAQSAQLRQPLAFEPNRGQSTAAVKFLARGVGYGLFITEDEAVFSLLPRPSTRSGAAADASKSTPEVLRLRWLGGQRPQAVEGLRETAGRSHLLSLDAAMPGLTDVPRYEAVALRQVYPGVDLIFYGNQGQLEYDFELAPGADPSQIRLSITGASSLDIDAQGALLVSLQRGLTRFEAPIVYQRRAGERVLVPSRYVIDAHQEIRFELAAHDTSLALVIDPVFVYSTYLGGNGVDYASGIALDGAGQVYVTGDTASSNFPTVAGGFDTSWNGGRDVFVSKFNAAGNGLIYSTYFGAAGDQGGYDIAVDSGGNAWVTGYYPNAGMFVLKLNTSGSSVLFLDQLTTLNDSIYPSAIAIDASNSAVVVGTIFATNLPTVNPYQSSHGGGADGFLRKYSSSGVLLASTYAGGVDDQWANQVAIGPAGEVIVTGINNRFEALGNVWVFKLNNAITTAVYGKEFGGSAYDAGLGVTLDAAGNAYVVGITESDNFPTANALQLNFGGGWRDGFVYKLDSAGNRVYSTYVGGSANEAALGVALNGDGDVLVAGYTNRDDPNDDAFLLSLDNAASGVRYSAVFGGSGHDSASAVAADAAGNVYVMGSTGSADFPVTPGAFQTSHRGGFSDGWVARIAPTNPTLSIGGASVVEGDSGTRIISLPLTISARSAAQVRVNWTTTDGSATTGDNDYLAASGTLVIPAGRLSATLDIVINGDGHHETNETFGVTLSAPVNAILGAATATATIANDDPAPTISIDDRTVVEGATAQFTVALSRRSHQSVSVAWASADGSATAPADYAPGAGTLTIPPGLMSLPITRTTVDDGLDEEDEVFFINLSAPTNATLLDDRGRATIVDNDPLPVLSIDNGGCALTEGHSGASNCNFVVRLSTASGRNVYFNSATANGTATSGADYTAHGSTLRTIAVGQTTLTIVVPVLGDTLDENDENFALNLFAVDNATPVGLAGTGTIIDDDPTPTLSIDNGGCTVTEGNSGSVNCNFVARLSAVSGRNVTFTSASASGTAISGSDFIGHGPVAQFIAAGQSTLTIAVLVLGDGVDEDNETFALNLSGVVNATPGTLSGTGSITDDDPAPTLSFDSGGCTVLEGNAAPGSCNFVARLSAASSRNVSFTTATANGTAIAGSDYTAHASTARSIVAGQSALTIAVPVLGDFLDEDDETFALNLTAVVNATPGTLSGTGTITDDDATPTLTIQNGGCTVSEGNSGTVNCPFEFRLSSVSGRAVSFSTATANGSATAGSDYTAHSNIGRILNPGLQTLTVLVPVLGDTLDEPDETFALNVTAVVNATTNTPSATGTIMDDDEPVSTGNLRMRDVLVQVGEAAGSLQLVVERSGGSGGAASVNYATSNGTAVAGLDYGAASGTLNWLNGDASPRTITLTIINDPAVEAPETFTVALSQASGAPLGTPATTTVTIIDGAQLLHASGFE